MHSIAFHIFGHPIHWYGICVALGFLTALSVLQYKRSYAGMTAEQIFDIGLIAIFCGIGGARLFYIIQFYHQFAGNFWKIFRIDQGGLVFYGGFLLAVAVLILYARLKKLSLARILDIYAPAIAFGHAMGRVGCFLEGCCYGKAASWGVVYPPLSNPAKEIPDLLSPLSPSPSLPLIPVQLFEAAGNIILGTILLLLFRKVKKPGQIAALYFAAYGLLRFTLEFFRGDHKDFFLGFTPAQCIGLLIMLPCGLLAFWFLGKRKEEALPSLPEEKEEKDK